MKRVILVLVLLIAMDAVYAQETCEYNGLKTTFGALSYEPGVKAEYVGEQFVHLADPKAVTNLEQIKGLVCLEQADFYNQGVSGNIENLKDLVNLKVFSLHTNPAVEGDICVFSKAVKLKSLKFAIDGKIYGDVSCLKDLNLETFAMTHTKISGDISALSHMTNLKALYIAGTDISGDISALSNLVNLEELGISNDPDETKITGDLASLDGLTKLRKVSLYKTKATNCGHFLKTHPGVEGGCTEASGEPKFFKSGPRGDGKPVLPAILGFAGLVALIVWLARRKKK